MEYRAIPRRPRRFRRAARWRAAPAVPLSILAAVDEELVRSLSRRPEADAGCPRLDLCALSRSAIKGLRYAQPRQGDGLGEGLFGFPWVERLAEPCQACSRRQLESLSLPDVYLVIEVRSNNEVTAKTGSCRGRRRIHRIAFVRGATRRRSRRDLRRQFLHRQQGEYPSPAEPGRFRA